MKDLMTQVINIVLDLGMDEQDLSFAMLQRNEKIKRTRILGICNKYQKIINFGQTDKARNAVAHQGRLIDKEVNALKQRKNQIFLTDIHS